jgi:hypothetical protein
MSLPPGSKERLAALIARLPARQGLSAAVPAAALLEVLQISSGIVRQCGDAIAATELEELARGLSNGESALLQQEEAGEAPVEPAPGRRRLKAPVLRLRG